MRKSHPFSSVLINMKSGFRKKSESGTQPERYVPCRALQRLFLFPGFLHCSLRSVAPSPIVRVQTLTTPFHSSRRMLSACQVISIAHSLTSFGFAVTFWSIQAQERVHDVVQPEEGAISTGRLLLEEAKGREDDSRGSHETESPGDGVHLWLLCSLSHTSHFP